MRPFTVLALAGLTTFATATPTSPSPTHPMQARQHNSTSAPCAQVSQYMYDSEAGNVRQQMPAGLAWDCLNTVAFNATSAKGLLKAIRPYIEWQSTLDVLADPPAEYVEKVQPAIDILGGLDKIREDIDAGKFKNEYAFGWSLYTLIQGAHDGHFAYVPDSVGGIFTWSRPIPLVSVSEDGKQLPAVFAFPDVLGMQFKNISYSPSPVVEIDGMDVIEFLENLSQLGPLQDRDALYNNIFYELAQVSLGGSGSGTGMFTGGGRGRLIYPGPTTTLKFANGTESTMENSAHVALSFRDINSGEDLASKWFSWGSPGDFAKTKVQDMQTQSPDNIYTAATPGFPTPIVPGPMNLINGFYIEAEGYEDVAVLQVPNFVGSITSEVPFQQVSQKFIPKALADGKTKLIIDLQANGGGTILQGYDLFKQLFPNLEPYGASRFRAIEAVDLIGQAYSEYGSKLPRVYNPRNYSLSQVQASYFDYHTDMTVDGAPFTSWDEKFGPVLADGVSYTSLSRWNLSDVYVTYTSGGINVTGYASLSNVTGPPPFDPENIIIVTDGYCSSTCALFSELMTQQGGVKTIAMGGRSNKNAIQAIGGVKGVNNYQFGTIQVLAQNSIRYQPSLNQSMLRKDYYNDLPFNRASGGPAVNTRDGVRYNDTSATPLQFVYEEADCRLYYTPEMTVDITSIWKAAADARWSDQGKCVSGEGDGGKRSVHEVTTKLSPRRVHVAAAVAVKQVEAFEKTFSLKTECTMQGDGFMRP